MNRVALSLAAGLILLGAAMLSAVRATAQPAIVTDENVSQMIANAKTRGQHEALAAFFDQKALAAEKEAQNHRAWGNIYGKPPMAIHCRNLVEDDEREAKEYKALAAVHREMAKRAGGQTGQ